MEDEMKVITEDEVVRSKELSEGTTSHGVHGSWFEIDKNSTWNIFTA